MLKSGSSSVSYMTSKSTVTYSDSAGTVINGLKRRSHRLELPAAPSLASMWKAPLLPGLKVLLVVQGTVLLPPACLINHPSGSVPGATVSKFSWNIVVGLGVPVGRLASRTVDPWFVVIVKTSSKGVPRTYDGES